MFFFLRCIPLKCLLTGNSRCAWIFASFIVGAISITMLPTQKEPTWEQLQGVVVFIGQGTSGSSLVGSILDAHPKVVIANEFNLLHNLHDSNGHLYTAEHIYSALYNSSKELAEIGRSGGGGYSYMIPGQWQGKVQGNAPLLIGDKKAGKSVVQGLEHLTKTLRELTAISRLPLKLIVVSRNPYDVIATRSIKDAMPNRSNSLEQMYFEQVESGLSAPTIVADPSNYFIRAETTQAAIDLLEKDPNCFGASAEILDIDYEDLVREPSTTMLRVCAQLGISCTEDYIQAVSNLVRPTYHYTRFSVNWDQNQICDIMHKSLAIPHLQRYMLGSKMLQPSPTPLCRGQCFPGASPCPCTSSFIQNCK